jgi:hypothetical protein
MKPDLDIDAMSHAEGRNFSEPFPLVSLQNVSLGYNSRPVIQVLTWQSIREALLAWQAPMVQARQPCFGQF